MYYSSTKNLQTQLFNYNIALDDLFGGNIRGHHAQIRADREYNGAYDMDDDIYACEPLYLESEVA